MGSTRCRTYFIGQIGDDDINTGLGSATVGSS
ncbi:hypothetical protein SAMN05444515_11948 [Ectothiorhodospira marina]|uniref:Uncharacterized protein n=1 Tax=Ectothiorhodospira marina TaxID=1396821 RepID=A0A1H7QX94_9GAMM|nr:hypothetical protein SAMN05444515_11948 [Ectothiorhodospira marina]